MMMTGEFFHLAYAGRPPDRCAYDGLVWAESGDPHVELKPSDTLWSEPSSPL